MRYNEIVSEIYYKADTTYRGKRLPGLEPDPVDTASPISAAGNMPDDEDPSKIYDRKEMQRAVTQALGKLSPKEEQVLRMRFFLDMTLEQIAEKYGVRRERIRQIEAKGLRKLKHPATAKKLKGFL
jgi:RNA polymerase primary sigma factor